MKVGQRFVYRVYDLNIDMLRNIPYECVYSNVNHDMFQAVDCSGNVISFTGLDMGRIMLMPELEEVYTNVSDVSTAGRVNMIQELLNPYIYDQYGTIIGEKEPLINGEQAQSLLNMSGIVTKTRDDLKLEFPTKDCSHVWSHYDSGWKAYDYCIKCDLKKDR